MQIPCGGARSFGSFSMALSVRAMRCSVQVKIPSSMLRKLHDHYYNYVWELLQTRGEDVSGVRSLLISTFCVINLSLQTRTRHGNAMHAMESRLPLSQLYLLGVELGLLC